MMTSNSIDSSHLDRRIEFAERKVLNLQNRLIEDYNKTNSIIKRLQREAESTEEMKKEWMRKKANEEERAKLDIKDLRESHRHTIEDLRLKYERERADKLRDIKQLIKEDDKTIERLRMKLTEATAKTRSEEAVIRNRHQEKLAALLRDEQSASRRGIVRQKRMLGEFRSGDIFSMNLNPHRPSGMKKRAYVRGY